MTATGHSKTRPTISRVRTSAGVPSATSRPSLNSEDPIGETRGEIQVVRDHERRHALIHERTKELEELHLVTHVERGSRLVEDQGSRLLGECPRQTHSLPLPTRERVHRSLGERGHVAPLERGLDRRTVGFTTRSERAQVRVPAEHDGLGHPQRKEDFLPLRQHADDARELVPGPRVRRLDR